MKTLLTPAGIEPATYRFVAQFLNHCATAVPHLAYSLVNIVTELSQLLRTLITKSKVIYSLTRTL